MEKVLKEKLEKVVKLVDNVGVDPEVNVEFHIPGVAMSSSDHNMSERPYILVEYVVSEYTKPTRKIHLTKGYLNHEAEAIADLVTFSIEQFKMEIDSVEMG